MGRELVQRRRILGSQQSPGPILSPGTRHQLPVSPGPSTVHLQGFTAPGAGFGGFVTTPGKTVTVLAAAPTVPPATPQIFTGEVSAGGSAIFFGAVTGVGGASPTEALAQTLMPRDCVAQDLQVSTTPALAGGESIVITLRVNGADTTVTCTVPAGGAVCNSGTATQALTAGTIVGMRVDFVTAGTTSVRYGLNCN